MGDTSSMQEASGTAAAAEVHFQATINFTVSVHRLDEARIQHVLQFYGGRTPANDPDVAETLARDTRLIEALLKNKEALRIEGLRRVIWSLDDVKAVKEIEQELGLQETLTDQHVLDLLAPQLPTEDVTYLSVSCDEDVFYDNSSFYQEALKATVGSIQITSIDRPTHDDNQQ
jgi:hypothetical protein